MNLGTIDFDKKNDEIVEERTEMESQMLRMASGMKDMANNFRTTFA